MGALIVKPHKHRCRYASASRYPIHSPETHVSVCVGTGACNRSRDVLRTSKSYLLFLKFGDVEDICTQAVPLLLLAHPPTRVRGTPLSVRNGGLHKGVKIGGLWRTPLN